MKSNEKMLNDNINRFGDEYAILLARCTLYPSVCADKNFLVYVNLCTSPNIHSVSL